MAAAAPAAASEGATAGALVTSELPLFRVGCKRLENMADAAATWEPMFEGRGVSLEKCCAAYEGERRLMAIRLASSDDDADWRELCEVLLRRDEVPGFGLLPTASIPQRARVHALVCTLLMNSKSATALWRVASAHRLALTAILSSWALARLHSFYPDMEAVSDTPEEAEAVHALVLASLGAFPNQHTYDMALTVVGALGPGFVQQAQTRTLEALLPEVIRAAEADESSLLLRQRKAISWIRFAAFSCTEPVTCRLAVTESGQLASRGWPFCRRVIERELAAMGTSAEPSAKNEEEDAWMFITTALVILDGATVTRESLLPTLRLMLRVINRAADKQPNDAVLLATHVINDLLREHHSVADRDRATAIAAVLASRAPRVLVHAMREPSPGDLALDEYAAFWHRFLPACVALKQCPPSHPSLLAFLESMDLAGSLSAALSSYGAHGLKNVRVKMLEETLHFLGTLTDSARADATAAAAALLAEEEARQRAERASKEAAARKRTARKAAAQRTAEESSAAAAERERSLASERAAAAAQADAEARTAAELQRRASRAPWPIPAERPHTRFGTCAAAGRPRRRARPRLRASPQGGVGSRSGSLEGVAPRW